MKLARTARLMFEVIWVLSCILTIVFAFCHQGALSSIALGSMWASLLIKTGIKIYIENHKYK